MLKLSNKFNNIKEIEENNWIEEKIHLDKAIFIKDKFRLLYSKNDYIIIRNAEDKTGYFRYYGKFPEKRLKEIENLVCW